MSNILVGIPLVKGKKKEPLKLSNIRLKNVLPSYAVKTF